MHLRNGFASAVDQAWLSLLNFAVSLAFIRFASKEEYGVYLLLLTPLYLMTGIQNALVLSPVATVFPAAPVSERDAIYETAISAQTVFVAISALVSGIGLAFFWYTTYGKFEGGLFIGFSLGVAGSCAREGLRGLCYTRGKAVSALISDGMYGVALIFFVGMLCYFEMLNATSILLATGIAALWPLVLKVGAVGHMHFDRIILSKFWACGRWALVGVLVAWINLNAYPLVVGYSLDAAAVADINVARLFLVPVALAVTAWSNLYRPKISELAGNNHFDLIRNLSIKSIAVGLSALAVFSAVLWLTYPHIEPLLGPTYSGLLSLVLLWGVFFAIGLARNILMATLMTNADGYRELQQVGWLALVVSVGGLFLFSGQGTHWVLFVLIAVETIQLLMVGIKAVSRWQATQHD